MYSFFAHVQDLYSLFVTSTMFHVAIFRLISENSKNEKTEANQQLCTFENTKFKYQSQKDVLVFILGFRGIFVRFWRFYEIFDIWLDPTVQLSENVM